MSKYASLIASNQVACKGCGITLTIPDHEEQVRCPYCGSINERVLSSGTPEGWLAQAELACNRLRFDDAQFFYRLLLNENPENMDALWGMIRCRYGVQFVLDDSERTEAKEHSVYIMCAKRVTVPVDETDEVHELRNVLDRVADDKHATDEEKKRAERYRGYISDIREQQQLLMDYWINGAEKDFDIFLCSQDRIPETDPFGQVIAYRSSPDSEWVHSFYDELMKQIQAQKLDIRVFYPPVTTTNFAGSSFAAVYAHALFSSRMMLLMGTNREAFDLPWIKAERERFEWLIDEYRMNRLIIPIMNSSTAPNISYKNVFPPVYGKVTAITFRNDELTSCVSNVIQRLRDLWKKEDPRDHFRRSVAERDYSFMRGEYNSLKQQKDLLEKKENALYNDLRDAEELRANIENRLEKEQTRRLEYEEKYKAEAAVRRNAENRERETNNLYIDLSMSFKRLEATQRETEIALQKAQEQADRTEQALEEARKTEQQLQKSLDDARNKLDQKSAEFDRQREESIRLDSMLKSKEQEVQHLRESSDLQLDLEKQAHQRDLEELKTVHAQLGEAKKEIEQLRKQLSKIPNSGEILSASPKLRLTEYGFTAEGSNGVPEFLGPDLNQIASLKHPERIRWIVLSLRAESAMRVNVKLQHRPSEMNETQQAVLRPKMIASVAFPIDPARLSAYEGTYQMTVTSSGGEQLLKQELQLRTKHV